jgi:hypothetical protein
MELRKDYELQYTAIKYDDGHLLIDGKIVPQKQRKHADAAVETPALRVSIEVSEKWVLRWDLFY